MARTPAHAIPSLRGKHPVIKNIRNCLRNKMQGDVKIAPNLLTVQNHTAVIAYCSSNQLLLFAFTFQYTTKTEH